jgi:hypothetical protein
MRRFHGIRTLAMLFIPLIAVEMISAAPPDPKLLSLVPPGTQLVAGISNRTPTGRPESFLLIGRHNLVDRRDFVSLAGIDDSAIVRQMIFLAGGSEPSTRGEHSMLIGGHFDQARIFKAAVQNGATVTEFRGVRVLVQPPFERELGTFKDVRWLAVLDSKVALFGTRFSVQQELDRYLAGSAVDTLLMQKVSRLRPDDATWSVLGTFNADDELEQAFGSLDPVLAKLIHDRKSFQFGVRYGKKVEVEYEVTVPSAAPAQSTSHFSAQSLVAGNRNGSSLFPRLEPAGDRASVHGVVKVTTTQYAAWLAEFARTPMIKRGNQPDGEAMNARSTPGRN